VGENNKGHKKYGIDYILSVVAFEHQTKTRHFYKLVDQMSIYGILIDTIDRISV